MSRIIAGTLRGRRLVTPPGDTTRPTSDRVREAVFSTLAGWGVLGAGPVVDLFAGSGALGFEAISRGAPAALFVDSSRKAVAAVRANAAALGVEAAVTVRTGDALRELRQQPASAAAVIFIDPPYAMESQTLEQVLAEASQPAWLAPDGVIVLERSARDPEPHWPAALRRIGEVRRYGETAIWYAEPAPDARADGC